jgi:hypothetical protein
MGVNMEYTPLMILMAIFMGKNALLMGNDDDDEACVPLSKDAFFYVETSQHPPRWDEHRGYTTCGIHNMFFHAKM